MLSRLFVLDLSMARTAKADLSISYRGFGKARQPRPSQTQAAQREEDHSERKRISNVVRKAVMAALRRHQIEKARLHIAVVDDTEIAHLHRQFLGFARSTDVLSFDLHDGSANETLDVEGDIVVSIATARREAKRRRHSVAAELALYAVHGTLHLLGYDDRRDSHAQHMHEVEDEILASVGLGSVFRTDR